MWFQQDYLNQKMVCLKRVVEFQTKATSNSIFEKLAFLDPVYFFRNLSV